MSDQEDNLDDQADSDEEESEMKAAYSINDLMTLDDDADDGETRNEDEEEEDREEKETGKLHAFDSDACKNDHERASECAKVESNNCVDNLQNDKTAEVNNGGELKEGTTLVRNDSSSVTTEINPDAKETAPATAAAAGDGTSKTNDDDEEIYPSSTKIQENKKRSVGNDGDVTDAGSANDNAAYANVGQNNSAQDNEGENVYDDVLEDGEDQRGGTLVPDGSHRIYENIDHSSHPRKGTDQDGEEEWGSSEFEEYEDSGDTSQSQKSEESLTQNHSGGILDVSNLFKSFKGNKLRWRKSHSSAQPDSVLSPTSPGSMLDKFAAKFAQKMKRDGDADTEEESCVVEVTMNLSKHPPPALPPAPDGLSSLQLKRRHIVGIIIESEKSYSASLLRLVEEYEKPLLEMKPQILQRDAIKMIFYKVRDILQCHNMFQIELAATATNWDTEEKIGDVFTASFSKALVFEVYSAFVINFSNAMDVARKHARRQPAFAEFLKQKLEASEDRLSLFGLIVKPVQRFPQFIMLLQDLLKFTPKEHHDRLSLQLALTELETLTDRLNETKRESESKLEVKRLQTNLTGIIAFKIDDSCFLVRQDDVIEIKQKNGEPIERPRRLFLLRDQLICTEVLKRESVNTEKFAFQWSIPVTDVEMVESSLPSSYTVHVAPGKTMVEAQKSDQALVPSDSNPYKRELDNMIHDLSIFQSMLQLSDQLRLTYHDFVPEHLRLVTRSLQMRIGQKCSIEHCLLTLSLPSKTLQMSTEKHLKGQVTKQLSKVARSSKSGDQELKAGSRVQFTFQFSSVVSKQDWLQELQNTKLATDPSNHPAWYTSESDQPLFKSPHFYHPLLLDITKDDSKKLLKTKKKTKDMIQCATYVTLPSSEDLGLGVQHLWVCNGDQNKGHVSIVSLHANQPCVIESFKVCDCSISCAESVPMAGSLSGPGDTVWMGTEDKKIIICKVVEDDRSTKKLTVSTDSLVTCIKHLNGKVFAGTKLGTVIIYFYQDGAWNLKMPLKQVLDGTKVSCLLPVNQAMWVSTNFTIHKLTVSMSKTGNVTKESHNLSSDCGQIECMTKAGVGLLVAFSNRAVIRLYHLETLKHLQDINIASAIAPLLEGKQLVSPFNEDKKLFSLTITCLLSGNGLLWVGTNFGFVVTLPLPRLEGVPQVKRRPAVSFHAHSGPVKFLVSVLCGNTRLLSNTAKQVLSTSTTTLEKIENKASSGNQELEPVRLRNKAGMDEELACLVEERLESDAGTPTSTLRFRTQWSSTPELVNIRDVGEDDDDDDDVSSLFGSLLKFADADLDSELIASSRKHRTKGNAVSNRVNKFSNVMRKNLVSSSHNHRTSGKCHSAIAYVSDDSPSPVNEEEPNGSTPVPDHISGDELHQVSTPNEGPTDTQNGQNSKNQASDEKPTVVRSSNEETSSSAVAPVSPARRIAHSKRLVVISGGEGHVNWKEKKPFDKSYEDICLLLWRC